MNPIAAQCQGPPDEYLLGFSGILLLEARLTAKITRDNVSELFQLLRETEYYKPTQQGTSSSQKLYLEQLSI